MKFFGVVLALALSTSSATAVAQRALVPIVDYKDVMVATSSGKPVTAEQVKEAIIAAGKTLNWAWAFGPDSGLVGTLMVNNKHTVSVDISVAADKYSVKYRSSINMKYGLAGKTQQYSPNRWDSTPAAEVPVIHPAYNQWVQQLVTAIDGQLRKL
jgi:hypothetical protein